MKHSDAFPSQYLAQADVEAPRRGTIDRLTREKVKSDGVEKTKTIMYFREEALKPLILNNVNWTIIEEAWGDESDAWIGKKIELYRDPNVMMGAKKTGGVRVRIPGAPVVEALLEVYTLDQAVAALQGVGLGLEELKATLKEQGKNGYSPARDTEVVKQIITDFMSTEKEL